MMKNPTGVWLAGIAGCLVTIGTASVVYSQSPPSIEGRKTWPLSPPPEGSSTIPVLVPKNSLPLSESISVCMWEGSTPKTYQVIGGFCRDDADHCTAFIAISKEDGEDIQFSGYDVRNPPIMAQSANVCTQPSFPRNSVLSRRTN